MGKRDSPEKDEESSRYLVSEQTKQTKQEAKKVPEPLGKREASEASRTTPKVRVLILKALLLASILVRMVQLASNLE